MFKYVGKSHSIHDAYQKATGTCRYVGDMEFPNMAFMSILFSPISNGIVESLDVSAALEKEGVLAVLHPGNTTTKQYNRFRNQVGQVVIEDERIFTDKPRFIGDRVAAVVATSREIAEEARKLIRVNYQELSAKLTLDDNSAPEPPLPWPPGVLPDHIYEEFGEKPVPSGDDISVKTKSRLSRINHITMETHGCIADYDRVKGQLTIFSPNQSVFGLRAVIADLFGMKYNKVRVVKTPMGGSFGSKQEWILEPVTAAAALAVGRPVKLIYNRAENMVSTVSRCPLDMEMVSTVNSKGEIKRLDLDATFDAGAYVGNSYDYMCVMPHKLFRNYKYPFASYTGRVLLTNSPVSGAFRGWTSPELAIAMEHNLNVAANKIGMDPIDLRLQNTYTDDTDMDLVINQPMSHSYLKDALKLGRLEFDWDNRRIEAKISTGRFRLGVGMAAGGHVNGYFPRKDDHGVCSIRINEDGSANIIMSIHDHGCGAVRVIQIIVGEVLGIHPDEINLREADSASTPYDIGCFTSRTTYVLGKTAQLAAEKLKEKAKTNAGRLGISADEPLNYAKIAEASQRVLQEDLSASEYYINQSNPAVHGVHFAEVQVDTYTGFVKVLDYLAIHDIGKAINPEICRAQIQGAVQMGMGAALIEEVKVNPQKGFTNSLKDYHLINAFEMPEVRVLFIEDGESEGPFGAKSIGELAMVPVAPTIVAAVNHALGTQECEIPMSPDRLMEILWRKNHVG